jgi:hypothetical protein
MPYRLHYRVEGVLAPLPCLFQVTLKDAGVQNLFKFHVIMLLVNRYVCNPQPNGLQISINFTNKSTRTALNCTTIHFN